MRSVSKETAPRRLVPLRAKVGAVGVACLLQVFGVLDDTAEATFNALGSVVTAGQSEKPGIGLSEPPPAAVPSAPIAAPPATTAEDLPTNIPPDCLGGTYDGWYFDPNADHVIDTIEGYNITQKDFLKFAVRAVCETVRDGAPINPLIAFTQASLESNSGQDTLTPYHNYHGHKAGKNDPYVEVWTKEDYGSGRESVVQRFKAYDDPRGSFLDYADMIGRLPWYVAAASDNCRNDSAAYLADLVHDVDPMTCQIIRTQGEDGVKSYATDRGYEQAIRNRAAHIQAAQYIYRP